MKKKFYEVVIVHVEHIDSEIQIDFRTRRQAEKFCRRLDFQAPSEWEVYINYHNLGKDIHEEIARLF